MSRPDIDFLSEEGKVFEQPKRRMKRFTKLSIYVLIVFVMISSAFGLGILSSSEQLARTFGNVGLWGQLQHLIGSDEKGLAGEADDRINVLLLGIGGENHDGPQLTDTIMLASYKPSTNQLALISIPRDLNVPIPGYGWRKINNANAFGELQTSGAGGELASQVVGQILNIPIHYYVRIDFAGFVELIDDVGGIDVQVENTLSDYQYPIPGKENATTTERYEHLLIEKGDHHFDGEKALKYVRSRHAIGIEGSDFARGKRQQNVLLAFKQQVLSASTLANPLRINRLMDTLSRHLATNLEVWEILRLFNMVRDIAPENIIHYGFDDSPDGLLYSAILESGAFVLSPKAGDFSEMQSVTKYVFNLNDLANEQPRRVEIQNGTKINGLASRTSQLLQSEGYQVIKVGNAPTQDYDKTVVYHLNAKLDRAETDALAETINATVALTLPSWITASSSTAVSRNADILIILGQDSQPL